MAKIVFELTIDTDNLDPTDRCYYDYVDYPIESSATKKEIDAVLEEIYEQMASPDEKFGTAFSSWFYNTLCNQYDMMCDILWDALDTYVQDELTARFKED